MVSKKKRKKSKGVKRSRKDEVQPKYPRIDSDLHSDTQPESTTQSSDNGNDPLEFEEESISQRLPVEGIKARLATPRNKYLKVFTRLALSSVAITIAFFVFLFFLLRYELETSAFQSRWLHYLAKQCTFSLEPGPSERIRFPKGGPFDERAGYSLLGEYSNRLTTSGFQIDSQAHLSRRHAALIDLGVFPIYREKYQTGLTIYDRSGSAMFQSLHPQRVFSEFGQIAPLIVNTLLFIEDRDLLSQLSESRNPAVEWDRFARALLDLGIKMIKSEHHVQGGSTLATQMEKFRHSSEGRTSSPVEKLQQMASAALRAYQGGRDTTTVRKAIARDYINSVPLAAIKGFGEVQGLGEGLWAYYDNDVAKVNEVLKSKVAEVGTEELKEQALAYRKVLSIFLAHRRPSEFFGKNPKLLEDKLEIYLPLLFRAGVIPEALFKEAMSVVTPYRLSAGERPEASFIDRKAVNFVRTSLLSKMGVESLYTLDRTDLAVDTNFNQEVQAKVSSYLANLKQAQFVKKEGLSGYRLLDTNDDLSEVIYSVTIYEKAQDKNILRVQTDSNDQPFNINQGGRLDLGSTAKFRTLTSYLEIVHELYSKFTKMSKEELEKFEDKALDPISKWAIRSFRSKDGITAGDFVDLAMQRTYSASPAERFFTAGGMHRFHNFSSKHNGGAYTVAYALRHSINLPFIRLMRDISRFLSVQEAGVMPSQSLQLPPKKQRKYLQRFAEEEGKQFVRNFWKKYRRKDRDELFRTYLSKESRKLEKLALAFWHLNPKLSASDLKTFLQSVPHFNVPSDNAIEKVWETAASADLSFADKAFIARIHPLEMWVFANLLSDPETRLRELLENGYEERQASYEWLFNTSSSRKVEKRIRIILEQDAFEALHKRWRKLGYSMRNLVASYATALGSSADKPASLATLMGIIVNDGMWLPTESIRQLHFAVTTPFETHFSFAPEQGERVLPEPVALRLKEALYDVVSEGTGIRLKNGIKDVEGNVLKVGGKTGTGDHRYKVYSRGGALQESKVVNRTATFMFIIDDRFFGTISAFVPGEQAKAFNFTSSLPVLLLQKLEPIIAQLFAESPKDESSTEKSS